MRHETKVAAIILAAFLAAGYMTLEISASMMGATPQEELYVALHTSDISTEEAIEQAREDYENEKIEAALLDRATVIEDCTVTFYDPCVKCCGKSDGITASGLKVTPYVTVAVDPAVIPLGSDVMVDYGDGVLHYYRADDTGPKGNHIDLCVTAHQEALEYGVMNATVYWTEAE